MLLFTEQDDGIAFGKSVRMGGEIAAMNADGVHFGDIFSDGQQIGHRTKRNTPVIHIESGDDDADATPGQFLAYFRQLRIKELGFVDADNGGVIADF